MVATPERNLAAATVEVVEIPVDRIKVTTRLRGTDLAKVTDIAESVAGVGLLHPISVSRHGDWFHLLDGMHRLESFRQSGRQTIPATIRDADPLIEELIEVEGNLCSAKLSAIDESRFIVRWEAILTALGKRALRGDNRWNRSGMTNEDLARSRGVSKRTYQLTKSISKLNPEVQDILNETEYANNKMDMVRLVKETDAVQLETANLLATGKCSSFKRALTLARCKVLPFDWDNEKKELEQRLGKPFSVRKWAGESSALSRLCKLLSHDEETRIVHRDWGTTEFQVYSQHPDHSAYFIDYYSKEGDLILDCMSGRGTNLLVGAALGRRVVGYDLNAKNLEKVRKVAMEHTEIDPDDLVLHHSDGCDLVEFADQSNIFDLVTFDPPYAGAAETYIDDERCLGNIKDLDLFYERIETCMSNLKRLVKPSNWEEKEFHPVVMKCGSSRKGKYGLHEMSTEVEVIAKKLGFVLHDKVINALNSQWAMFTTSRCIDYRYSVKNHEYNLVWVKY